MLALKRKDGQWTAVTHRSGEVLYFRVYAIAGGDPGQVNIAFDDPFHHFDIERMERRRDVVAARAGGRGANP